MKLSYGIDFGTTNSTVAYVDTNNNIVKLPIDPDAENPTVMRSIIYVSPDGRFLFGKSAVDAYLASVATNKDAVQKAIFTGNYIKVIDENGKSATVPEIIDVNITNGGRLLQALKSALSSHVINEINLFGNIYQIEEVVGMFLKEMKIRADKIVGSDVKCAVIGRPVEYVGGDNDLAVKRMSKACKIAGFTDIKFEYEPVGAAYDYGVNVVDAQHVLVFDFGGGTLDISIFKFPEKEVVTNTGLPIGGDYFNSKIFMDKISKYFGSELDYGSSHIKLPTYIFRSLQNWYEISLLKTRSFTESLQQFRFLCSDVKSIERLESLVVNNLGFAIYEKIERVKKGLSKNNIELYEFNSHNIEIETPVSRVEFENIIKDDLQDIQWLLNKTLTAANLNATDIDVIATTGGSSLVPSVQALLIKLFGESKIQKTDSFTGVASGLAIIARQTYL